MGARAKAKVKKVKQAFQQVEDMKFKDMIKTIKKMDGHDSARSVKDAGDPPFFLSTGDDILDLYISNRKNGGVAGGRITQLGGLEGAGKSLVCAHLIKSCQALGGIPVLIDTQAAVSWQFMQAIGVDVDKVIYYDGLTTIEKIHRVTQELMYSVKSNMPDVPMLIVVDSLTAAATEKDLENTGYENKGYQAAIKAKMNSQALRKLAPMVARQQVALVYTAQVRQKLDVMNPYMDQYESSSGGRALQFYASTRVRLTKSSQLKEKVRGVETVVGVRTRARIDKSRLGPANRSCTFDVYYDMGIDNYSNWVQTLKKYKLIQGRGTVNLPWTVTHPKTGQVFILKEKDFRQAMKDNEEMRQNIYDVLAEVLIMEYKNIDQFGEREIIVGEEEDLEQLAKMEDN